MSKRFFLRSAALCTAALMASFSALSYAEAKPRKSRTQGTLAALKGQGSTAADALYTGLAVPAPCGPGNNSWFNVFGSDVIATATTAGNNCADPFGAPIAGSPGQFSIEYGATGSTGGINAFATCSQTATVNEQYPAGTQVDFAGTDNPFNEARSGIPGFQSAVASLAAVNPTTGAIPCKGNAMLTQVPTAFVAVALLANKNNTGIPLRTGTSVAGADVTGRRGLTVSDLCAAAYSNTMPAGVSKINFRPGSGTTLIFGNYIRKACGNTAYPPLLTNSNWIQQANVTNLVNAVRTNTTEIALLDAAQAVDESAAPTTGSTAVTYLLAQNRTNTNTGKWTSPKPAANITAGTGAGVTCMDTDTSPKRISLMCTTQTATALNAYTISGATYLWYYGNSAGAGTNPYTANERSVIRQHVTWYTRSAATATSANGIINAKMGYGSLPGSTGSAQYVPGNQCNTLAGGVPGVKANVMAAVCANIN